MTEGRTFHIFSNNGIKYPLLRQDYEDTYASLSDKYLQISNILQLLIEYIKLWISVVLQNQMKASLAD